MQHDKDRPEDLDTNMEDHAADDLRYACMARPYEKPEPEEDSTTDRYRKRGWGEQSSENSWLAA